MYFVHFLKETPSYYGFCISIMSLSHSDDWHIWGPVEVVDQNVVEVVSNKEEEVNRVTKITDKTLFQ